jgi:hypothetical protein
MKHLRDRFGAGAVATAVAVAWPQNAGADAAYDASNLSRASGSNIAE